MSTSIYELLRELNERVTICSSRTTWARCRRTSSRWAAQPPLFYHGGDHLTPEMVEQAYQCPVDLVAHGVPHRVFAQHALDAIQPYRDEEHPRP